MEARRKRRTKRLRAAVAVTALAGWGLVALAGTPASAEPTELTLDYTCDLPRVGERSVSVEVTADVPELFVIGEPTPQVTVGTRWTLDAATRQALREQGIGGFGEGTGGLTATVTVPDITLPLELPLTAEPPADGFSVEAGGEMPSLTFASGGEGDVTIGDIHLSVGLLDTGGYPVAGDPAGISCVLAPGQDSRLARWVIVHADDPGGGGGEPAPSTRGYDIDGSVHLRPGEEGEPLSGHIELDFDDAAGTARGESLLRPTTATLTAFGILPVTAHAEFDTGTTTGTFTGGRLAGSTPTEIRIPSIEILGLPVGGGEDCRASEPSLIELWSPEDQPFDPETGGHLVGTYDIAPLENCGPLTALISAATTGEDFGIALDLTAGERPPDWE
ncbi:DUF6801 domain-containing protein [Streptomyces sp. URMC 129]|uniref:DUF6801 domain-containing protein n=1 Tax=Streptomyces sp. URMC 129 TaxID=3423407 RepID=UPI003F1A12E6